jgi:hypothetical protein
MCPLPFQLLDHREQMAHRTRQPIELHHHERLTRPDRLQQTAQRRAAAVGPGGLLFQRQLTAGSA